MPVLNPVNGVGEKAFSLAVCWSEDLNNEQYARETIGARYSSAGINHGRRQSRVVRDELRDGR